jgi:NADH-dependent peroxiredoxin subunit F
VSAPPIYDVVIVGAGPAGMTAAVYCARKQLRVALLTENIGGQALWSSAIENYLGYEIISGAALVGKFEDHLKKFPIDISYKPATKTEAAAGGFKITAQDGSEYIAKSVIIASGKMPRTLDVPGEFEFRGKGLTYCATCDAPLFSGADVAVVGGGNSGFDAVMQLIPLATKIYVVEFGPKLLADEVYQAKARQSSKVEILTNTQVIEIAGDVMADTMTVRDRASGKERVLLVKGIFVEIGLLPNSGPAKGLVELNKAGEIKIDNAGRTSRPGVFAAGDVTDVPDKQIIVAAGEGAKAALSAYEYLVRAT